MKWIRVLALSLSLLVVGLSCVEWGVNEPQIISTKYNAVLFFPSFDPIRGSFLGVGTGTVSEFDRAIPSKPFYSLYNPSTQTWTEPELVAPLSSTEATQVSIIYLPTTDQFLALWSDYVNNQILTYSIYTPIDASSGNWSFPETISPTNALGYYCSLSLNAEGKAIATWRDLNTDNPMYAYYTPSLDGNGTWEAVNFISNSSIAVVNVVSSYDSITGETIAIWVDSSTRYPIYSIYQPEINEWSIPLAITQNSEIPYYEIEISLSFDPSTGQTLAMWIDSNTNTPTYSFYSPRSGWSDIGMIPLGPSQEGVAYSINILYDTDSRQWFAIWQDSTLTEICYSFYTPGSGWAISKTVPNPANYISALSPFIAINFYTGQILATWAVYFSKDTFYPIYSIFQGPKLQKNPGRKGFFQPVRFF